MLQRRWHLTLAFLTVLSMFCQAGEVALSAPATLPPAPEIKTDDFQKLHALIKPGAGESRWAEIAWMTCLWEARQRAAAEGKPLLIWYAAEGNPIGLT